MNVLALVVVLVVFMVPTGVIRGVGGVDGVGGGDLSVVYLMFV